MLDKAGIDQFYKDVEALALKFPVAAIAGETGYSKGNVSDYLKKRREPSEGFLNEFYKKFSDRLKKVPGDGKNLEHQSVPVSDITAKYIALLEEVRQKEKQDSNALLSKVSELERIARQNSDILNRLLETGEQEAGERAVQSSKRAAPLKK